MRIGPRMSTDRDDGNKDNENTIDYSDPTYLGQVLGDVPRLFDPKQDPISKIKGNCLVALDANILLLPYQLNKTTLDAAAKVYKSLHAAERLVNPAQAAREFVVHRAGKIGDIVAYLRKEANSLKKPLGDKIGFLENENDYTDLKQLASQIEQLHKKFRNKATAIADLLAAEVGNDPTSKVYASLGAAVVDFSLEGEAKNAFGEDLKRRTMFRIPPGYKDGKKVQGGPGDLLIWKTILATGKAKNKDCIFVTAEEKTDWWVRNHGAFQPRVELIEEYRTVTGGRTIHIVVLSKLLEIFEAGEEPIADVRSVEQANTAALAIAEDLKPSNILLTEQEQDNALRAVRWHDMRHQIMRINRQIAQLGNNTLVPEPERKERLWELEEQKNRFLKWMKLVDRNVPE
jgi:PIN like domain